MYLKSKIWKNFWNSKTFKILPKIKFSGWDQNLILGIYSFALWFWEKLQSFLFTVFWEKYEMFCIKFIWKYEIDLSRYHSPGSALKCFPRRIWWRGVGQSLSWSINNIEIIFKRLTPSPALLSDHEVQSKRLWISGKAGPLALKFNWSLLV